VCVGNPPAAAPKYLTGLLPAATSASTSLVAVAEPTPAPTIASSRVPRNAAKVKPDAASEAAVAAAAGVRSPSSVSAP
jgi:hypothetical protein